MFNHDKLIVYQRAADFVVTAEAIAKQLPRGRAYLVDQLRRAATSIQLNIAEGAGEFGNLEKARFYRMAMRSAAESAALIDVCRRLELVDSKLLQDGKQSLDEITAMLVTLARRFLPDGVEG